MAALARAHIDGNALITASSLTADLFAKAATKKIDLVAKAHGQAVGPQDQIGYAKEGMAAARACVVSALAKVGFVLGLLFAEGDAQSHDAKGDNPSGDDKGNPSWKQHADVLPLLLEQARMWTQGLATVQTQLFALLLATSHLGRGHSTSHA